MLNITDAFKQAIDAPVRQIKAKIEITFTDAKLDTVGVDSSSTFNDDATPCSQAFDENVQTARKWFTLIDNCLDGTYYPLPSAGTEQVGWWSKNACDSNGIFSPAEWLEALHTARQVNGLCVVGDNLLYEYPVDFTIELLYSDNPEVSPASWQLVESVTGNTDVVWKENIPAVFHVTGHRLTITKWNKPNRLAKVVEFYSPVAAECTGDEIISLNVLEERELSNGSLPIGNISANKLELQLNNIDRRFDAGNRNSSFYGMLRPYRCIKAWFGVVIGDITEWLPMGVFFSKDWKAPDDQVYASVSALDRMELLRKDEFRSKVYIDTPDERLTLYRLAEIILEEAGVKPEEYMICESLKDTIVSIFYFDTDNYREALRIIAEAALSTAYCNRDGIIVISDFAIRASESIYEFSEDINIMPGKDNPVEWSAIANYVTVEVQSIIPDADNPESTIYSDPENQPKVIKAGKTETYTVTYSPAIIAHDDTKAFYNSNHGASLVIDAVGANLKVSAEYFAKEADITVTNNGSSDVEFRIEITGQPLKTTQAQKVKVKDEHSIRENGKVPYTFSNPLVQTLAKGTQIAGDILNIFRDPRRDMELISRGNPALELGDRVTAPDSKISKQDYYITKQSFQYDGALNCEVSGRKAVE